MTTLLQTTPPQPVRTPNPPVSVVILTFNEEGNIAACIESCGWCDDIHVLDSGSTDRTCEIARRMGAQVHYHPFSTFGEQRNWAIDHIPCKHGWHFHLDADERFTPALVEEIDRLLAGAAAEDYAAYLCPSKIIFMGKWLKHSGGYPAYQVRLFRPGKCRFIDFGHGQREQTSGGIRPLEQPYIHLSFSKGLVEWFGRHNYYSTRESREGMAVRGMRVPLRALFSRDGVVRRRAFKNLSFFLRARAVWRFLYHYFFRWGLLDGVVGFHYCAMISMYEYWVELKIKEQKRPWQQETENVVIRLLGPPAAPAPEVAGRPLVEVMIPTYNEAGHIETVVKNALSLGPVFVLDSRSTDGTQEMARRAGAVVVEHAFEGYSKQKNWGIDHLPLRGEWLFILDADERITPALRDEALRMAADGQAVGYFVNRLNIFMGQPIRYSGLYPSWNLRFFRRGRCRYEDRTVHEHMIADGRTDYLREEMLHVRLETVSQYLAKHIHYADLESDEWVKTRIGASKGAQPTQLFRRSLRYRQWIKRVVWPRLSVQPLLRFLYMYFIRLGFLDGAIGWRMAVLMAQYEYMIALFYKEKMRAIRAGQNRLNG